MRTIERHVRFEEVDALQYMWHGRYASWLEDGREDFGRHYGISYLDFHAAGVATPLKTLSINFIAPLRYAATYQIETSLLWNEAAVIEFNYRILDDAGSVMTEAETTQLMISLDNELLLSLPGFYKAFCQQWQNGLLK